MSLHIRNIFFFFTFASLICLACNKEETPNCTEAHYNNRFDPQRSILIDSLPIQNPNDTTYFTSVIILAGSSNVVTIQYHYEECRDIEDDGAVEKLFFELPSLSDFMYEDSALTDIKCYYVLNSGEGLMHAPESVVQGMIQGAFDPNSDLNLSIDLTIPNRGLWFGNPTFRYEGKIEAN